MIRFSLLNFFVRMGRSDSERKKGGVKFFSFFFSLLSFCFFSQNISSDDFVALVGEVRRNLYKRKIELMVE